MGAAAARVSRRARLGRVAARAVRDRPRSRRLGPRHALVPALALRRRRRAPGRAGAGALERPRAPQRRHAATAQRPASARLRGAADGRCAARGGRAATTSSTTATCRALFPEMRPQPDAARDLPARRRRDPRAPLDRGAGGARRRRGRGRARAREVHRALDAGRRGARLHATAGGSTPTSRSCAPGRGRCRCSSRSDCASRCRPAWRRSPRSAAGTRAGRRARA